MYERFTDRSRKVMRLAARAADRWGHLEIGPDHMLYGLVEEGYGVAANVLRRFGVDPKVVRRHLAGLWGPAPASEPPAGIWAKLGRLLRPRPRLPHSPAARAAVEGAVDAARRLGHPYVGTEHLLLGLVRVSQGEPAIQMLTAAGATPERVEAEVRTM